MLPWVLIKKSNSKSFNLNSLILLLPTDIISYKFILLYKEFMNFNDGLRKNFPYFLSIVYKPQVSPR